MRGSHAFRILILSLGILMMLYYAGLWIVQIIKGTLASKFIWGDAIAFFVATLLVVWMLVLGRKR